MYDTVMLQILAHIYRLSIPRYTKLNVPITPIMHAKRRFQYYKRLLVHILWQSLVLCVSSFHLPLSPMCASMPNPGILSVRRDILRPAIPRIQLAFQSLLTMPRLPREMRQCLPLFLCSNNRRRRLNSPLLILNNAYRPLDCRQSKSALYSQLPNLHRSNPTTPFPTSKPKKPLYIKKGEASTHYHPTQYSPRPASALIPTTPTPSSQTSARKVSTSRSSLH